MDGIFQVSDLATKRTEFLQAARDGRARIRDTDGTELVALRASDLITLEEFAAWSSEHRRLVALYERSATPSVVDLGRNAWLRVFERTDIDEFLRELEDALIASLADNDASLLDECVHAWQVTAQQLEDPLRRSVLMSRHDPADFVDARTDVGGSE